MNQIRHRFIAGILLTVLSLLMHPLQAQSGLPFFRNYTPTDYQAHNRNFDIISDQYGRVFVANFEGLLYYDQAQWHILHAPGIFRFTTLYKDTKGTIWFGGYNIFGYLEAKRNGTLQLHFLFSNKSKGFLGEVLGISENKGKIQITNSLGNSYLADNSLKDFLIVKSTDHTKTNYNGATVNQTITLNDGRQLLATEGKGLIVLQKDGDLQYHLTEDNGLCSNNVNHIYADRYGYIWGATDNGIFLLNIDLPFTQFTSNQGLHGDIQTILMHHHRLYVGTLQGIYIIDDKQITRLPQIHYACWNLQEGNDGYLYASTSSGLFRIQGQDVERITANQTLSMLVLSTNHYLSGELDGIYSIKDGKRTKFNSIEKATEMLLAKDSSLWVRNIFGQVFHCKLQPNTAFYVNPGSGKDSIHRYNNILFKRYGNINIWSKSGIYTWDAHLQKYFKSTHFNWPAGYDFPQLIYPDPKGNLWITNNRGVNLTLITGNQVNAEAEKNLNPLKSFTIRSIYVNGNDVWIGTKDNLIHWSQTKNDPDAQKQIHAYIRRLTINNDSILWGGYHPEMKLSPIMKMTKQIFSSDTKDITFEFSSDQISTLGDIQYRFRFNDNEKWSAWSGSTTASLINPRPGEYRFEVMAKDRLGRVSEPISIRLYVQYPIYIRWYSILTYIILLVVGVFYIIKLRMKHLLREKAKLEHIIEERTSQIRQQKDEIEEKSNSLETALISLKDAQHQLIRQERMATVGKLTQGLVDRILNPMNYVNNFSHMSIDLLSDLNQNLQDEKDNMNADAFEDSADIVEMLKTNLEKIESHGINTTKILKAMEEMLREKHEKMEPTDIARICRKNIEMFKEYFRNNIEKYGIQTIGPDLSESIIAEIDADLFSKTIMSILANSSYAIEKKYQQHAFQPEVRLSIHTDENLLQVKVYDNGIGIEPSIIEKIFDPFFTTKTTAEAVGVGLYLSRETILNHGGDISVSSVKNEYTEVVITLPLIQHNNTN